MVDETVNQRVASSVSARVDQAPNERTREVAQAVNVGAGAEAANKVLDAANEKDDQGHHVQLQPARTPDHQLCEGVVKQQGWAQRKGQRQY